MTITLAQLAARRRHGRRRLDDYHHLVDQHRVGPVDTASADEILALLPQLPDWSDGRPDRRSGALRGAKNILAWLEAHPGTGWQERWLAATDTGTTWVDHLASGDLRSASTKREENLRGLVSLLLCRVILPGYGFLTSYNSSRMQERVRQVLNPDAFARLEQAALDRGLSGRQRGEALGALSKIVLHTGKDVDQLTPEDLLELHVWSLRLRPQTKTFNGLHSAWDLLGDIGLMPPGSTLRSVALRRGTRPAAELVDSYHLASRPIRDVLIRYLDERRPAVDYGSFRNLVGVLVGRFWADIEQHHPGLDTLHLPDEVAQAWKERIRNVTGADGEVRPRQGVHHVLMAVRALYLDIQQWALEDPSWVPWAVPSPVRASDTTGQAKARRKAQAAMHQRIRQRLPHLPALADTAERCHSQIAMLMATAAEHEPGEVFDHARTRYRRTAFKSVGRGQASQGHFSVEVENLDTGTTINLTRREDEAFWAWVIVETLRHTGVRLEELLEITHLALVSYQLPDTDEVVPLLQIVPSKTNEERLLLVSPELASVLATVITRLRKDNGSKVPLVARYDPSERVTGPPLPHLFQRKSGTRQEVISTATVYNLINIVLEAAG
ncbi:site-specific integrase [Streptomyces sp. NBC_00986]|uniref:site-specific integrase n=1 Tax=Streptomyces sp. NBC_00986 TaxID=2903702 RepID=UPI003870B5CA|nr:site-specific integrase [Streptomyces sp. NBC_00986]